MNIIYKQKVAPNLVEIAALYNDVGWSFYTNDLGKLERAMGNSPYLLCAFDETKLVGLLRAVGDEETIMYIQDILVLENYQRYGIGKSLVLQFEEAYRHVRQKVL